MNFYENMEENISPSTRVKRLEADVRRILRRTDQTGLERKYREAAAGLVQNLTDIRIYVNAYELSEERDEQLGNAKTAKKWLAQARQNILKASEADVFGAADTAQLTAQIDLLKEDLK